MGSSLKIIFIIITILLLKTSTLHAELPVSFKNDTKLSVVVIDPGHGGKDPGAVSGKAKEKEIVLDIALKLADKIRSEFSEVKVILTRKDDTFIPLHKRANIANKSDADLFISIHANAAGRTSVQGAETFVLGYHRSKENLELAKKENAVILLEDDYNTRYEGFDPNSPESYIMFELIQDEYLEQSVLFASAVQDQFKTNANRIDRSVKQAGFLVLRRTTMPGVLIEAGFLSHSSERKYLLKEQGREQIAHSVFNAFREYKKRIEEKSSFNLLTETQHQNDVPDNLVKQEKNSNKEKENSVIEESDANENLYFSVQIAASKRSLQTIPSNFKGENSVFKISSGEIHRYYCGRYSNYTDALAEKSRLQRKFGDAFVVAFKNNELVPLKKVLKKM